MGLAGAEKRTQTNRAQPRARRAARRAVVERVVAADVLCAARALIGHTMAQVERGLVSVIIPTHDRGALLMQTLESVRRQTYACWEAIVVDDDSSDDTANRVADTIA